MKKLIPLLACVLCALVDAPAAQAVTNVFFNASQTATVTGTNMTSTTIRSLDYLFTYSVDGWWSSYAGGPPTGRFQSVFWPDGIDAQAITAGPTVGAGANITIKRVDGKLFDFRSFTGRILLNTAGAGGAFELMPQLNGQDAFANPLQYDCSGYAGMSFSYTPALASYDTYVIHMWGDYALTALTLVDTNPIVVAPTNTITASISPVGAGSVGGAGSYPSNTVITLAATPNAGWGFQKWTENGAQVSTSANYNFTVRSNRTLVAWFVPAFTVTTAISPGYAGTTTGAGTYNSNSTVTVAAPLVSGLQFVNWTWFGTPVSMMRSYSFTVTGDRALVANYTLLPQSAIFDFDTGYPPLSVYQGMPSSQSNRTVTASFSAPAGAWSSQTAQTSVVGSPPSFSGKFLYPSTWGSTLQIQFSEALTDLRLDFMTGEISSDYDVAATMRVTAYTNSVATPAVGSTNSQGSWINGAYPEGRLAFHSATPFNLVKIDVAPIGVPSWLFFVDNIVVQRVLAAPTNVTITTSAFPSSGGTTAGDGTFTNGASVTVTATNNAGYTFMNWTESGASVSTSASYTFTATNSRSLIASFAPAYSIAVSASPSNGGRATGGGIYFEGANVPLTATASNGFIFVNWTEAGVPVSTTANYNFPANADRTLVANFTPGWTINTSSSPTAGGTTSGGGGYMNGASVTLAATPNPGYVFVNWTRNGNVVSTSASYTFTATANRTFQANFLRVFTITTSPAPVNGGNTTGDGSYTNNASVTVTATPHLDFVFVDWTEGGTTVSTSSTYTFPATADRALMANFLHGEIITTSATPPEGGTTTGDGTYPWGTTVTVSALTNTGFVFVNWSENGNFLTDLPDYAFTATGPLALVATFAPAIVITASADPAIGGTISGDGLYAAGQWVNLWASPNPDFAFVNWTVNGVIVNTWEYDSFVAETNVTLVAHFTNAVTILTSSSDPNAGTSGGDGVFPAGATVGVIAAPKSGYAFLNWTENGDPISASPSHTFTATTNRLLVANFVPDATRVTFDFDTAAPVLTNTQPTFLTQTSSALTAEFSSPADPAAFSVQSGWAMSKFSGNFLTGAMPNGDLEIRFSQPVTSIALAFSTFDYQDVLTPSTVELTAFVDNTNTPIGTASAVGTVNYAESAPVSGWLGYSSAMPFNLVRLHLPSAPAAATSFAVDNLSATLAKQITGSIALEYFQGVNRDGVGQREVTFKATDATGIGLQTWSQTLDFAAGADGFGLAAFTLTGVPEGTSQISAKTAWHLCRRLPVTFASGLAFADFVAAAKLLAGDVDGNNAVDGGDYLLLASAWYTTNPVADLDGSGLVDIEDYFLLASHWQAIGDPE